ncbi:MAG: hypothetical protein GF317_12545 [Candidatus Lokiarchaeota archaeon]|nr:hypothetical protein [Candidatus Lokiarchaeota archaeon]MBD3200476.1 hypothetical protein [Candidatus Lokiarchaeota archaeon]
MVKGVALIQWDVVEGGIVKMKYPDGLNVPENIVQQIQISHNFTESYIITEEKHWNSISFYNEEKQLIILLVLGKYDDGTDYIPVLEEFNKEVETDTEGEQLKAQLERLYNFSLNVFRTRDEVISKLSNEVAQLRTMEYDYKKKFEKITEANNLPVKSKIQFLLAINEFMTLEQFLEKIDATKAWIKKVLKGLETSDIIGFTEKRNAYYLQF